MQLYRGIIGYCLSLLRRIERDARHPNILYTNILRHSLNRIVSYRTAPERSERTVQYKRGQRRVRSFLCAVVRPTNHGSRSGPGLWSHPFLTFWSLWLRRGWKSILPLSMAWRSVIMCRRRCRRRHPPVVGDSLLW